VTGPSAGDYRQWITLQRPTTPGATDSAGQRLQAWTDVGSYNAKVYGTAGVELTNALRLKAVESVMVEMRWNGLAIVPTWRILYNGRTLLIESAINEEERNIKWKLTCKEVKNKV
jgi:SPP1 family predicted phage head-tail adaptor